MHKGNMVLPDDKMPEAEVTLRFAIALIEGGHASSSVETAIDGAQIKTKKTIHFPIVDFLNEHGWFSNTQNDRWQSNYAHQDHAQSIIVHSTSGEGDLVVQLKTGFKLRVESKKGPLIKKKGSKEYPLIREAIGQLMTIEHAEPNNILAVAVPHSKKFADLASQWRERPLMKNAGIHIVTVDRQNKIRGLEKIGI